MSDITALAHEVLRLDAEATPGPWEHEALGTVVIGPTTSENPRVIADEMWIEDSLFVALTRSAAPALARRVLRLREFHDAFTAYTRLCQAGQTGEPETMDAWVQVNLAHEDALADDGGGVMEHIEPAPIAVTVSTGTQKVVKFFSPNMWAGPTLLRTAADWMDAHGFDYVWDVSYYNGETGDTLTVVLEGNDGADPS